MTHRILLALAVFALAGCGTKTQDSTATSAAATPAATASKFDGGPRAAEQPVDDGQADRGESLFKDKGCSACHGFGVKMSGPDLAGVTQRRTALWMENQILHPEVMTKEDPIARELFAAHALQMPNQGLSADEARAVIEFLKHRDREATEEESHDREKHQDQGGGS